MNLTGLNLAQRFASMSLVVEGNMHIRLLVALAFTVFFACPSLAENSANVFLKAHDSGDAARKKFIEEWASAVETGLSWGNIHLEGAKQPRIYCPPSKLVLEGTEIVDMARRSVEKIKPLGEMAFGLVIMHAMREAFPCKAP